MIEQFTDEELKIIIKELNIRKSDAVQGSRNSIILKAAQELDMGDMFMCTDLRDGFYKLVDFLTENKTRTTTCSGKPRDVRNNIVPTEKREEYKELVKQLLTVMKPYYGMLGFRAR